MYRTPGAVAGLEAQAPRAASYITARGRAVASSNPLLSFTDWARQFLLLSFDTYLLMRSVLVEYDRRCKTVLKLKSENMVRVIRKDVVLKQKFSVSHIWAEFHTITSSLFRN